MKKKHKVFWILLLCVFLLYLVLFIFSFSKLYYYDEHYIDGTPYLSWPDISLSLKIAVVTSKIIGFPFGFMLFFLNSLVIALVLYFMYRVLPFTRANR